MEIPVRYLAMHNTDRRDVLEEHIRYREAVWDIDPREAAFVLVDFWSTHILRSHLERSIEITEKTVAPLVAAARKAGFTIVHAPGFTIAKRYPQWEAYAEAEDRELSETPKPDWPPEAFRKSEGPYAGYAKPFFTEDLLKVGKETEYTLDRMLVTRMAVQQIELYHASTASDALLKACRLKAAG